MPPRNVRKTNQTVLFAVEGDTEFAFLSHVKGCYVGRECNVSVKIKNARGAGPLGIVDALVSGARGKSYDFLAALFDSDIPVCDESRRYFEKNGVKLFQSTPAIEGTILRLGNHRLQENMVTSECKRMLARLYPGGDSMDVRFYERHFNKELLDASRERVLLVDGLINYLMTPT